MDASTDGGADTVANDSVVPTEDAAEDATEDAPPSDGADDQADAGEASDAGPMCSTPCVHGTCLLSGGCSCDANWSGPLCDMPAQTLVPGASIAGNVTRGAWSYFSYYGQASGISVTLSEDATTGLVWTYLAAGMVPTQSSNLAANEDTQSATHTATYSFASSGTQTWYVGAFGQPAIPSGTQAVAFHVQMTVIP